MSLGNDGTEVKGQSQGGSWEEAGESAWVSTVEGLECYGKELSFHSVGNRVMGAAGLGDTSLGWWGRGGRKRRHIREGRKPRTKQKNNNLNKPQIKQ